MKFLQSKKNIRGVTVIETVVSIAVFSLLAVAGYSIYTTSDRLIILADQKSTALFLAEEGIEAARSIRDGNFANLTTGTKGLLLSGNAWTFFGVQDTTNGYVRSLIISTVDTDTKSVASTVSWNYKNATSSVTLTSSLTNWHKTAGMSTGISIDTTNANLSLLSNRRLLTGISLITDGTSGTTTISQITVSWSADTRKLQQVRSPNGTIIYSATSINSGTTVTLASPLNIVGAKTQSFELYFNNNMSGNTITFTLIFSDGSTKSTTIINPPTGV